MPVLCVDLSRWDGNVSIPKLKEAGVGAVIAKCGGGDVGLYEDSKWEDNYANCKAAGMPVGAYFYSAATTVNQAIREAEYVLKLIKGKQLEYPVYIDVEEKTQQALSESTLRAVIQAWLDTIGDKWMRGVYTWSWLMPTGLDCETWFCAWTKSKPCECGMWQFGGETNMLRSTTVAGYKNMDQSYAYKDYPSIIKAAGLNGFSAAKEADVATATVYIHGGDFDCSEMVRMCYRAVDVLPYGSYMWTGNQISLLKAHGFKERSLSNPQMGDVLWREGHTEMYLGDGMQGGARISEYGTITGTKGDQTGKEITRSAYRASDWTRLLRYEGDKTVGGIPAAIAAALVADHIIDHNAHGYSQPNRAGDGTIEAVTITWNGDAPKRIPCNFNWSFDRVVRVRTSPDAHATDNIMTAKWRKDDIAAFDGIVIADGCTWGTYIGPTTGRRLYAAIVQGTCYGEMV